MNSIKQSVPSEFFSESAVAIFIITPDHEVIFWNKACEELTGMTSHEMLNTKNHWQPFYKEYRSCLVDIVISGNYSALPELYEKYGKSTLSPEGVTAEGWYENLGGKKRYIIFDAVPIFNSSGEIVAAIETLQDLTELKQVE
ncbi:MAG: PAS domain-containing protein, partial [Nitrospirae bacterium]|nr:PAS domain-containing protein [Nitrospirota bacterium]